MPNHFHVVVRIRKREEIEALIRKNFGKVKNVISKIDKHDLNFSKVNEFSDSQIQKYISKQFANLFSCYTQSFNKMYHRMGSLFAKNFKREQIHNKRHFLNAVIYTHRNSIHHGFCKDYNEWAFSSYNQIIEGNNVSVEIFKLLKMMQGIEPFVSVHHFALKNFEDLSGLEIV